MIGTQLVEAGWEADDLKGYVLTEMAGVLVDEPTLSAENLKRLLQAGGKTPPTDAPA